MKSAFKEKARASFVHLLLSILIVTVVLGAIVYFWYPLEYLGITRFSDLVVILIAVDLVIGPVLTFIIYNRAKASLPFDLAIIALLQFGALAYGGYALFQNHPLYITFAVDRYTMVTAQDATPSMAQHQEYDISKLKSGVIAFAQLPDTLEERNTLMLEVAGGAPDLDKRVRLYKPYKDNIHKIVSRGLNVKKMFSDKTILSQTQSFTENYGGKADDYVFLPFTGPKKHVIMVVDKSSASPITIIDADPWKYFERSS